MPTDRAMFDFSEDSKELPCEREKDGGSWRSINDHTGCIFNDGLNTCTHRGDSLSPLEDE